jgi:hypothetical protein
MTATRDPAPPPERPRGTGGYAFLPGLIGLGILLLAWTFLGDAYSTPVHNLLRALPFASAGAVLLLAALALRRGLRSGLVLGLVLGGLGTAACAVIVVSEIGYLQRGGESAAFAGGPLILGGIGIAVSVAFLAGLWRGRARFASAWSRSDGIVAALVVVFVLLYLALPVVLPDPPPPEPV